MPAGERGAAGGGWGCCAPRRRDLHSTFSINLLFLPGGLPAVPHTHHTTPRTSHRPLRGPVGTPCARVVGVVALKALFKKKKLKNLLFTCGIVLLPACPPVLPTQLCLPGVCRTPCGLSSLSLAGMPAVVTVISALQASGVVGRGAAVRSLKTWT